MAKLPLQVCLIAGSVEQPSRILASLDFLAHILHASGVITHAWDLANDPLPLFDPRYYPDPYKNPSEAVRRLAHIADQADAFVWGTPVYHNSFSGVLKNALDSLSLQQYSHKPVALVSCGNSERTGGQPCDQLRIVARGLLAVAIPTQLIAVPTDFTHVQQQYYLSSESLRERAERLAEELIMYATMMRFLRANITEGSLMARRNGIRECEAYSV